MNKEQALYLKDQIISPVLPEGFSVGVMSESMKIVRGTPPTVECSWTFGIFSTSSTRCIKSIGSEEDWTCFYELASGIAAKQEDIKREQSLILQEEIDLMETYVKVNHMEALDKAQTDQEIFEYEDPIAPEDRSDVVPEEQYKSW